ncbi:MAG: cob(I)yrinic acid a,c-diamide adenosyltransferase [Gammaproteobacteria bacterium]|nr:cob(I)yrinic acid a,c-diamide adenosyltransferase [Gammaproteobacteria bacterium]MCP5425426.1 cob(I)yrinic acid a,c-diamide adenosyltransferase [Gammaproteobacteria bacterium]MCP5459775.1 cob(I)yrinic acid a,c-diamide adenosyltransferase [Gammaproteobacteria bacterium]
MGHRLSKIYTRTGDKGTTGLGDGGRIDKDSLRIETIGQVDELNCTIGMVLVHEVRATIRDCLSEVQHKLFDLGGELSMPGYEAIRVDDVTVLERELDVFNGELPPLKEFILPGGGPAAAPCHLARAVCRRAERHMVSLSRQDSLNPYAQAYLNRLSDLLFVLCRILARDEGGQEVLWRHDRQGRKIEPTEPEPGP